MKKKAKLSSKKQALKDLVLKDISQTIDIYMKGRTYKDQGDLMESLAYDTLCTLLDCYGLEYINGTIRQALGCHLERTNQDLIDHPESFTDPLSVSRALARVRTEIEMLEDFDDLPECDGLCDTCKDCQEKEARSDKDPNDKGPTIH